MEVMSPLVQLLIPDQPRIIRSLSSSSPEAFSKRFGGPGWSAAFFFAAHIDNDAAGIHHDEAVAKTQGIPHIVRNHEACQMVPGNDFCVRARTFSAVFGSRAAVCSSKGNLGWFMAAISGRQSLALSAGSSPTRAVRRSSSPRSSSFNSSLKWERSSSLRAKAPAFCRGGWLWRDFLQSSCRLPYPSWDPGKRGQYSGPVDVPASG